MVWLYFLCTVYMCVVYAWKLSYHIMRYLARTSIFLRVYYYWRYCGGYFLLFFSFLYIAFVLGFIIYICVSILIYTNYTYIYVYCTWRVRVMRARAGWRKYGKENLIKLIILAEFLFRKMFIHIDVICSAGRGSAYVSGVVVV